MARHRHGYRIHSPLIFEFISEHISDNTPYYCFDKIEVLRKKMKESWEKIEVNDLGAGSVKMKRAERKISQITRTSSTPAKYGEILFKMVNFFKPKTILEFGTSLGVGTAYLASFNSDARVISLEGCSNTAAIATRNLDELGLKNIQIIVGGFEETIGVAADKLKSFDFVFFDGNHQKKATLDYFNFCLQFKNENSVFVFDDIYWSKGMSEAWREIKNHKEVYYSIDLFRMGIIFFRKDLPRKQIRLRL